MSVLRLPSLPASAGKQQWGNLPGAALSLAIAEAANSAGRLTLVLTEGSQSAERLQEELAFFAPDLPVLHFPDWETLPYDLFSPHQDIISQRIATLYRLPELTSGILVVPITTALHRLAPRRFLLGSSLVLDVGQRLDVEEMRSRLEAAGYRYVDTVYEHGEFTVRGALIDLFPMGSDTPYRIDLFDDEIETLRTFDPDTQRSVDKVQSIRLLPAREFPLEKRPSPTSVGAFASASTSTSAAARSIRICLPGSPRRYRVLPAALLRGNRHAVRLPAWQYSGVLPAGNREGRRAVLAGCTHPL